MIDEGDDCAYVIGNNVRHSGQFCIKFLFCYLIRDHTLITLAYKGTYLVCKMLTTIL